MSPLAPSWPRVPRSSSLRSRPHRRKTGTTADTPKTATREQRGRLPNFFRHVVTATQREKMYDISKKYESQIAALEKQLADLEAKRDAEIEAMLTPEQKSKLVRVKSFFESENAIKDEADKRDEAALDAGAEAAANDTPVTP